MHRRHMTPEQLLAKLAQQISNSGGRKPKSPLHDEVTQLQDEVAEIRG